MCGAGKQMMVAAAVAMSGALLSSSADAGSVTHTVYPGDLWSDASTGEVTGVSGDGTIGGSSWRYTSTVANTDDFDYFYVGDLVGAGAPPLTIRDIVRMSLDTKRSGPKDFTIQIETEQYPGADSSWDDIAIDFAMGRGVSADSTVAEDVGAPGAWYTYEWNRAGNVGSGIESTLHQHEGSFAKGGNEQNNPWLTLSESISTGYSWLDQTITGIKISARDDGVNEWSSQLDNFTITYETTQAEQTVVVDFAAVPTPSAAAIGITALGGLLMRRRR